VARRVGGARPLVVTATDLIDRTDAVVACVRDARSTGATLRLVGGGRWLDAGRPCQAAASLPLGALRGVTEYEPGDLTLTARAGTTLAEIADVAAREGQWLTLEPHGSPLGTIGATIATASWGPLASAFGTPRDHLLGCEVVTGRGEVIRAGGRVVKNVAGFDLARLMTGSWGTLGAITEVAVRLRARPEVDRTLAVSLAGEPDAACAAAFRWLRSTPFTPLAAELCSASMATRIGIDDEGVLLIRLGGNEPLVRAAERSVAELGTPRPTDVAVWDRLRMAEWDGAAVVRLGALPSNLGILWMELSKVTTKAGGCAHATLGRGVVRCILPAARAGEESAALRGIIHELRSSGSRIAERLPVPLWRELSSPIADPLSTRVRETFDPDRVLNPGILGPLA
jgi:glycolate oxidase FAD binding subunit